MLADPEVLPLITSTAEAYGEAMQKGIGSKPMPSAMRSLLEQNIFIFSGFKTHAELSAVSALLLDENGKKKPFERFAQDVKAIDENYNRNYLRAEYNFATQSARSAAQWAQYQSDGDQFYLQYRTAADERVRESHALLHGTTLPVDDPFWKKFFPPNGWNCRCTVVQVRKSKYPLSDSQKAIEKGEKATTALNKKGQNKLAIFRFNPGQEQKIFPPRHPYLPKGCGNCNKNQLDYKPNNPMCQACISIDKCSKMYLEKNKLTYQTDKEEFKRRKGQVKKYLFEKENLTISGENYYTKHIHLGHEEVKCLLCHSFSANELDAIHEIQDIIPTLQNGSYSPINTSRPNYKKKMVEQHIRHFVKYEIDFNGTMFELKCKAIREKGIMKEYPYSLKEK